MPVDNLICALPDGSLCIPETTQRQLAALHEPLAVVTTVGNGRTGKSSLLQRVLRGRVGADGNDAESLFEVSSSVHACTKGIRCYTPAVELDPKSRKKVLILDTEGLMATDSDDTHDTRIFALSILLSSSVIYNVTTTINENTLSTLRLAVQFASMMAEGAEGSEGAEGEKLAGHMPDFSVLVRDFALRPQRQDGSPMTPTEWLESILTPDAKQQAQMASLVNSEDKAEIRRVIKELFPRRKCYTLPRPTGDDAVLAQLDKATDAQLAPAFVQGIDTLRRELFAKAPLKTVMGATVNGPGLLAIAHELVDRINSGKTPRIRDSWALVTEINAMKASEDALRSLHQVTETWPEADMSLANLRKALDNLVGKVVGAYREKVSGSMANEGVTAKLMEEIPRRVQEVLVSAVRHRRRGREAAVALAMSRQGPHLESLQDVEVDAAETVDAILEELAKLNQAAVEPTLAELRDAATTVEDVMAGSLLGLAVSMGEAQSRTQQVLRQTATGLLARFEGAGAAATRQQVRDLEDLVAVLRAEVDQAHGESSEALQELRSQHSQEIQELRAELTTTAGEQQVSLERQRDKLTEQYATSAAQVTMLQSEQTRCELRIAELEEELAGCRQEAGETKRQEAKDDNADLKAELRSAQASQEAAELAATNLREQQRTMEEEFRASLEQSRRHTEEVVAECRRDAEAEAADSAQRCKEAEQRHAALQEEIVALKVKTDRVMDKQTVQLESSQKEVNELKKAIVEQRRQEQASVTLLQRQIGEQRKEHQSELSRVQNDWQLRLNQQGEERTNQEIRIAQLEATIEFAKREREQSKDSFQEAKRMRIESETAKVSHAQVKCENETLTKLLDQKKIELLEQRKETMALSARNQELERQLAVEKYKTSVDSLRK